MAWGCAITAIYIALIAHGKVQLLRYNPDDYSILSKSRYVIHLIRSEDCSLTH